MQKMKAERLNEIVNSLFQQTDRAAAVIAGCILDDLLKSMIASFFLADINIDKKMFDGISPLSTFSSKINIVYCTGLINKQQYGNIMLIKKIRDLFAHSVDDLSFETPQIKDRCLQLINFKNKKKLESKNPKEQFKFTVTLLSAILLTKTQEIKHLKLYEYKTIKQ